MSTQNISTVTKEKQQDRELKLTLNTKYFAVRKSERRLYLIIHPSLFFCMSSSGSDSGAGTYLSCYRERLEAGYSLVASLLQTTNHIYNNGQFTLLQKN